MENIARSADRVGRAHAWAGGSGQGTGQILGAVDTEAWPHKEKEYGMICSTGMMEKAPRGPVLTLHSVLIFIICAGYIWPISALQQSFSPFIQSQIPSAGLDKTSI